VQLRIPGPTPVPEPVREAEARPMIDHRGPEFAQLIRRVTVRLQTFFQTTNDVLILTASGTGALEAAIVNTLSPGDRVLAVIVGVFGDRFASIARAFGADVTELRFPEGRAADPDLVRQTLERSGPFKSVLVTHNETSTGVTNDLSAIAGVVKVTPTLLIVDAISSLGSIDLRTDEWGCDVVLSSSQKGWMVPPGLAFVSVSPVAWEANRLARMPRFYWDLGSAKRYLERGQTPATPAVSIFFALDAALGLLEREGRDAIFARHHRCAERVRSGVKALGLELFAEARHASDTVTSVAVPADLDVVKLLAELRLHGVVLSGGQGSLTGKIFRIGHLGWIEERDVDEILVALANALPVSRLASRMTGGG
jgi:aspartate aminotransferase-like enzyme